MASVHRNLVGFLLFLLNFIHLLCFNHAASTSSPHTRQQILFLNGLGIENNYEDEYVDPTSTVEQTMPSSRTPRLHSGLNPCQFDLCAENQEPCHSLAEKTNCLCPGMSGSDEPPRAPRIKALQTVTEGDNMGKIEVLWCAPASMVSSYKVVIEGGHDDTLEFGDTFRRGLLGSLEVGTKVCVEAVNSAGISSPSEFSCERYEKHESSDNKVWAWFIGGAAALFLLLVITAVILWKHLKHRKAKRSSANGPGNISYNKK